MVVILMHGRRQAIRLEKASACVSFRQYTVYEGRWRGKKAVDSPLRLNNYGAYKLKTGPVATGMLLSQESQRTYRRACDSR